MAVLKRKKNSKRMYGMMLFCYLIVCGLILGVGFMDARHTMEEYNASQAKLVSGLLVENVNVALDNAVAQVEEVSYAIAGGREDAPEVIVEELNAYAGRSDTCSTGFIADDLNVYGQPGDQQDLVSLGYLKQAVAAQETFVTDPFRSRISAKIVITIFVPVYKGGERFGTVYAYFPLDKLQEYANMNNLSGDADIYLINCRSLNSIVCSSSRYTTAGTWNNLALQRAAMEFNSKNDYQFYIAKMQNGVKGDTVRYRKDGVDYTQGYERIEKMKDWYLAVEIEDRTLSGSMNTFRDKLLAYGMLLLLATVAAGVILIVTEITQKKNFEKLSGTDAMTGLYNKKTFTAHVEEYLTYEKNSGVLIFVDVDDFKCYNDKYGHLNGDAVLKKFARELQEEFAQTGIVGRYGGDEFIVFLKNISDREYVDCAMEHLKEALSGIELEEFGEVSLSFSAGGARCPQDGATFVELCKLADEALYKVKADGKGNYYWYQSDSRSANLSIK